MFNLKKIAAAMAIAAAAGGAHAANWNDGAAGADGELFFIAKDNTTNHTFVLDLGVNYSTAAANFGQASFFSSINLGALVTAGTGSGNFNFTNVSWNIAGTREGSPDPSDGTNNGLFATVNKAESSNPVVNPDAGYFDFLSSLEVSTAGKAQLIRSQWVNDHLTGNSTVVDSVTAQAAYDNAWGNNIQAQGGNLIHTSGSAGGTLDWYHWYLTGNSTDGFAEVTDHAGTWTLSNSGVLSYAAPSAVPVPAAAWLFGTGLAGLGVFGRRRNKAD